MDRPGVRQAPEGSGEQGKMEETGCEVICDAPTTLAVRDRWWWWLNTTWIYSLRIKTLRIGSLITTLSRVCGVVEIQTNPSRLLRFRYNDCISGDPQFRSHLVRTQRLNVLPLKPGVGQFIDIHATLTARDFFLAYFYPSSPFTCIFSKTSPNFFLCWPAE